MAVSIDILKRFVDFLIVFTDKLNIHCRPMMVLDTMTWFQCHRL